MLSPYRDQFMVQPVYPGSYQGLSLITRFPPPHLITGPFPVRTECPLCKQEVLTETYSSAGLLAWLLGGGLCLIGCAFGCCLIPCCVDVSGLLLRLLISGRKLEHQKFQRSVLNFRNSLGQH